MRYLPTTPPNPLTKKNSLQIWIKWDYEKKYKFGVITHLSTYLGCNNITTFFIFWPPPLMCNKTILRILCTEIRDLKYALWDVLYYSSLTQKAICILKGKYILYLYYITSRIFGQPYDCLHGKKLYLFLPFTHFPNFSNGSFPKQPNHL